jgi:hypothetical protein
MRKSPSGKNLRRAIILAPLGMALFCASAHAATLPERKPGLWQTTMTMQMTMNGQKMGDNTPIITGMCSDAQTDAIEMKKMQGGDGKCQHFSLNGSGDTYTMDGACPNPMGTGTMTTHGTITMEGDTAMHMVSDTHSSSMAGHMVGDSKWIGACPAGIVPGDVGRFVNGQFVKTTNILNQPKAPSAQ